MVYEYADNITRINQLMRYANMVTDGLFGIGILLVIFFICFIAMRQSMAQYPGQNAKIFSAACFVTTFFSVMFFILGIISSSTMYICIFVTAGSIFANIISGTS